MGQPANKKESVLPPDMEASLKAVRRILLWSLLCMAIPCAVFSIALLKWIMRLGSGVGEDVVLLLFISFAYSYVFMLATQRYIQYVSEKRGFVCPRCHKALFQVFSKNNTSFPITGRCPSCNYGVVKNPDPKLVNQLENKQTETEKKGRWPRIVAGILALIAIVFRYESHVNTPESRIADLLKKGSYDQAIVELNKEIQANPKNAQALAYRGIAYREKGMKDEAMNDSNQALSIAPSNYVALATRCSLEADARSLDAAISDCTHAIQVNPGPLEPYLYRAVLYVVEGQYDLAEKDINQLIQHPPASAPVQAQATLYAMRGDIYLNAGRLDDAQQDFEKAKSLDPNAFTLFTARGEFEVLQGAYADAITDLSQGVKQIPSDPSAMMWLHLAKFHSGQDDQAELQKMRGGLKKQEWPSAVVDLYAGQGTVDAVRAQAATGDASILTEQACEADYYIGEYYLQQKDLEKAKASLQAGISSCPPNNSIEKQAMLAEFKAQGF